MEKQKRLQRPDDAELLTTVTYGWSDELFRIAASTEADLFGALQTRQKLLRGPGILRLINTGRRRRVQQKVSELYSRYRKERAEYDSLVATARMHIGYRIASGETTVAGSPDASTQPSADVRKTQVTAAPSPAEPAFARTIAPRGSSVESLFTPRTRPSVMPSMPDVRSSDRIYLPIPERHVPEAVSRGATVGPKGGVFIHTDADLDRFEEWLPFYARKLIEPINVDLIPMTNWGGSLANILTAASWNSLRQPALETTGHKCALCGLDGRGRSVDCHEIWEYFTPLGDDRIGVQRLVDILPVCNSCHEIFHLGLANVKGRAEIALTRLGWLNRWEDDEVNLFTDYIGAKWQERNTFMWMLDLTRLGPVDLTIKKEIVIDEDNDFQFTSQGMESSTRFIGPSFHHPGQDPVGPHDPVDYMLYEKHV